MKSLLIIGSGSLSTEIDELARLLGYTEIAFVDDNVDTARCQPVVGSMGNIRGISGKCGAKNRRIQRLCRESILT